MPVTARVVFLNEFAIYIQQKEPLEPKQQQLMIRIAVAIRMIVVVAA